ncbi:TPA: fimbria/pilus outer membrane usher protein [Klebsiella pneumoniae]|uniref:fimbria/pilus outer membrane usher protein n=1 Tax=Klebsiella pneumoniae TaxID=573 RepID=UPI001647A067|nr:fimbria/pilus outer membrane usher protein [Klebsiella pneumoniae]MBC4040405.1 fimbrial biogenesis outer membrane usher protein [Klebsiella pneumoniae]MCM6150368.1 fimbrial biogenesis outer membrane usher protein [Klebsiella pneumoniae]MCY0508073.1 fimbrial biogenesis outer membrane usher protein [Klebsiella pneumoniae]MDG0356942.1 fimbrial biogenesis outer membrane usher protein [Klebsiella pneumoniae]HBQ2930909.1 fimbrial biogenesis outer membrane usher protein [Klebsiella pneumoniae]
MGQFNFNMKYACLLMMSALFNAPAISFADEFFNPALLEVREGEGAPTTDLSVFEVVNGQPAGNYRVDIYVNNEMVTADARDVMFSKNQDGKLEPCVTLAELSQWGVDTASFPELAVSDSECANLAGIPDAFADFQFNRQKLNLSIPHAAMNTRSLDEVPIERWDEGIPALLLNYNMNSYQSRYKGAETYESTYLNLRPGLNIGPWRLRNYTTFEHSNQSGSKWDNVYSYLQRNIVSLRSQLTLGDSSAPADVFDSVPFRGFQMASDDDMLPSSVRNYAPVIRGVARSNALVTIRQNGYVVYETKVAPGAFEISDLASTGGAGDLDVTIKEADGSEQHLRIPYASLPVLQREGKFRYSVTGGQFRAYDAHTEKKLFVQGTGIYGLPWGFTLYGGVQNAGNKYQSYALGVGKNIGSWGAFSADAIHSRSMSTDTGRQQGQSLRVRYSKNFLQTGTNFTIAGYRYSTSGFRSLEETLGTYRSDNNIPSYITDRRRNRAELSLNQDLGDNFGALNASLISEDYWQNERNSLSANLGYYKNFNAIGISLNYSWNRNTGLYGHAEQDNVVSFEINVPLDKFLNRTYASYGTTHASGNGTSHNLRLNGSAFDDASLDWGINATLAGRSEQQVVGGNVSWKASHGTLNGSYSRSRDSQQLGYGIAGGVVIHENGITLSQSLGETIGLVKAPGAEGIGVNNYAGISTDSRGYAVVPYLTPYRRNDISLNSKTLRDDTDITYMTNKVVPTRGAIVRAEYKTAIGHRVLMTLTRPGGKPVPFGAMASLLKSEENASIVGDGGEVLLSGLPQKGTLQVKWGNGQGQETTCRADYIAHKSAGASGLWNATSVCQ